MWPFPFVRFPTPPMSHVKKCTHGHSLSLQRDDVRQQSSSRKEFSMKSSRTLGEKEKPEPRPKNDRGVGETVLRNAFAVYDTDQSGCIDAEELQQLLKDLHWPYDAVTIQSVLAFLDNDSNGMVCIEEFLKWHDMAYEVRVLSPRYGNTPWSAVANEPQLTPNPLPGCDKNVEIAEVSAKLGRIRELAEQELEQQANGPTSLPRQLSRGCGIRSGPQFVQNPTGSLLETIDEGDEDSDDEAVTARSLGPRGTHRACLKSLSTPKRKLTPRSRKKITSG